MKFKLYQDNKREWRWRLLASNGKIIADSAEGYKKPSSCLKIANKLALKLGAKVFIDQN